MYEGAYGRIVSTGLDTVIKIPHRRVPKGSLSLDQQKAIHAAIIEETTSYTLLTAPRLVHADAYEMGRIDVEKVIFLGCQGNVLEGLNTALLVSELARLWKALYKKGYIAWDFELYLQPDGRVAMVDFDKFKTVETDLDDSLFIHPCFPRGFKDMVFPKGQWAMT
jgi:hypothetical protein